MTNGEYILWGFKRAGAPSMPIKLSGGSLRECRGEQKWAKQDGWVVAIYKAGAAPVGLRAMAEQGTDSSGQPVAG